jgi:hypothetical protein
MRLDIDLNAPVVIVPQTSDSNEALYIDLGRLTLNNVFQMEKGVILEIIELSLKDMKIARLVVVLLR